MRNSIRRRLTSSFIALAVGPLLLVGAVLAWQSFTVQQQQALTLQGEVARRVSTQVAAFINEQANELRMLMQVQGLNSLSQNQQINTLSGLISYNSAFDELTLLDAQGREQTRITRFEVVTAADLGDHATANEFALPRASGKIYYSPVYFQAMTGEPLLTIAVPIVNARSGLVDGVLVADVRIKPIWDLMTDIEVGRGGSVYMVDAQKRVVAHRNPSVVLRGTQFTVPEQDGIHPGLTGTSVVLATSQIRLGEQVFTIVVEQPVSEALAPLINTEIIIASLVLLALVISGGVGFLAVRQIVQPIEALATAAQAISAGELSQQVQVTGHDEIGALAVAFNSMTSRLRDLIGSLEQRVAERTAAAETARNEAEAARQEVESQMWLARGQAALAEKMRGEQSIESLANGVTAYLCQYLGAHTGALFLASGDTLKLTGRYAYTDTGRKSEFRFGENLLGGVANAKQVINIIDIPDDAPLIFSALGQARPKQLLLAPIETNGQVFGVIELATLNQFSAEHETFLQHISESIAIAFQTAQTRERVTTLLSDSQQQTEELQAQEEELRTANEELQAQSENSALSDTPLNRHNARQI